MRLPLLLATLLGLSSIALVGCAAGDSAPSTAEPPTTSGPPAGGDAGDDASPERTASCSGALTQAPFAYQSAWGQPVASFVEGDEELVFFGTCTLVRLEAKSGTVRSTKQICSEPSAMAVARDADGYWLATSHAQTSANGKSHQELRLALLDRSGASTFTRTIGTSGAYEDLLVFPSKSHVALTATVSRSLASRALLVASKASLTAGDTQAVEYTDPYPDSNLFDVVRWRDDGIEGFRPPKRGKGAGIRYRMSVDGKLVAQEDAAFYGVAEGACQIAPPRFFGHVNTAFVDGDVRFVALESTSCTRDRAIAAQLTMRSPAGGTAKTDLATIDVGPDDGIRLCLGSPTEAVVVRARATEYELDRFRYDRSPAPAFQASLPSDPASGVPPCPVATSDGYLVPTLAKGGAVQVTRLRCAM